jgi:hypothetical protein
MDGKQPIVDQPQSIQILDGSASGRTPLLVPRANSSEELAPRAGSALEKLDLLAGLAKMDTHGQIASGISDRLEKCRGYGERGVRDNRSAPGGIGRESAQRCLGCLDHLTRRRRVESQKLVKHCAAQAAARQQVVGRERVGHVANECGSRRAGFANCLSDWLRRIAALLASKRHQFRCPHGHGIGWWNPIPHPRQLEMRVRIDQTRKDRNVAEVDGFDAFGQARYIWRIR